MELSDMLKERGSRYGELKMQRGAKPDSKSGDEAGTQMGSISIRSA
jgi:hypothetical protein